MMLSRGMKQFSQVPRAAAIVAGVIALAAGWPAAAQQPSGTPPSQFTPIAPPTIDLDSLKKPQDAPRPELVIPKGIEPGKSPLEFDARQTRDVIAPRVSIDSGETSNLSKVLPGQKEESPLPDYFGLKLTKPTR